MRLQLHRDSKAPPVAADLKRRFDDLLEHLPAGVTVHDTDGCILLANHLATILLGRGEDEPIGIRTGGDDWRLVHEDLRPMAPEVYPVNRVLRTRTKVMGTVLGMLAHDAAAPRWMICNAYPEFDDGGSLAGAVVCFTDCSALKDAQGRLAKSEERLRLMLQGSSDAPWDWDLVTGETYYSERWWDMLGYRPGELPADRATWRRMMHPDDLVQTTAFMAELLLGRRQSCSIEFRLRHRAGQRRPLRAGAGARRRPARRRRQGAAPVRHQHRPHRTQAVRAPHLRTAMGIAFSLDDFGNGHSSLAFLTRFPLAALKINRTFVRDVGPASQTIVEAIVALARKLKLEVVAQGVEHEAQRAFMVDCGCDTLQGYLLGRPVPLEEFERLYGVKG